MIVTPYAGVWIEIERNCYRWICRGVTPYAGVWIEIIQFNSRLLIVASLPTRECGLKLLQIYFYSTASLVTPYAGVWIEISTK